MSKTSDIADEILKRIRTNAYNEKIPGERMLSEEFDVNVKTANRAVSQLVEQGVLYRKRGEGTFIAPLNDRSDLCIGLCFFKHTLPGHDPVFNRFFSGVNAASKSHGLRLDVTALKDVIGDNKLSKNGQMELFKDVIFSSNPDGLLYLGNINSQLINGLIKNRPTVVIGHTSARSGFDSVRRDLRSGVSDAVRLFANKGHKRIALATYKQGREDHDLNEKKQGYLQAMAELGFETNIIIDRSNVIPALKKRERPTAVIAAESTLGLEVMHRAPEAGLRIPDDVAVISFDDGDVGEYTQPSMSSIHAFGEGLAQIAIDRLLEKIDGRLRDHIDEVRPCPIIERASSG